MSTDGARAALLRSAASAALTPARFSDMNFRWKPYPYQQEVMDAILLHGKTRIAWVAGRRVGKTDTVANVALQLAVRRPGTQVAIFAPTQRQARHLSERVKYMLYGSRFHHALVRDNVSELRLRFGLDAGGKPRESVIYANSLTGQVRGQGADVLIVDESAFCSGEDYRNKALPFVADRPGAIVIHISTVWADDDHFSDALREYGKLPHGAVFRTPTRLKPGVTKAYLDEQRRTMTESEFRREFECALVPESGVFDRRALQACLRDYPLRGIADLARVQPRRHHDYFMGVDWGKKQDRAVIAVVEQGTQEKNNPARLVFLHVYEPDPSNPHHYARVIDDVQRVATLYKAARVVADEGEGRHQAEVLRRALGGRVFEPYCFTGKSRNWLVDHAQLLVDRGALELPMEPDEVRKAFANIQRTDHGYEHSSRKTKDVFDAIALALRGVADASPGGKRARMRIATGGRRRRGGQAGDGEPEASQGAWWGRPENAWVPRELRRDLRSAARNRRL